jgi:tryptophan-rich sensory protein
MDWWALAAAAAICVGTAGAEGALTGKALPQWLASLRKPRLYAPMGLWIAAAVATYAIQGFIAYRLLSRPFDLASGIALAALLAVMAGNVAYNVVLARARRARVAYLGILAFLPLLAALQLALLFADRTGFWVGLVYVAWVVLYDLPIMRALWILNDDARRPR